MNPPTRFCSVGQADWDAVVIGAGPAGSLAARQLARAGPASCWSSAASSPVAKVCGGCLNASAPRNARRRGAATRRRRCDSATIAASGDRREGRPHPPSSWGRDLPVGPQHTRLRMAAEEAGATFCFREPHAQIGPLEFIREGGASHNAGWRFLSVNARVVLVAAWAWDRATAGQRLRVLHENRPPRPAGRWM